MFNQVPPPMGFPPAPNQGQPQQPMNPANNLMQQFNQFCANFQGDPQQMVQQLIQSGRMTQQQFEQYSQLANRFFGRR